MNTVELSGMSSILQSSELDRGVQNRSPEAHFNTLLKKNPKNQNLSKLHLKKQLSLYLQCQFHRIQDKMLPQKPPNILYE